LADFLHFDPIDHGIMSIDHKLGGPYFTQECTLIVNKSE